MAIQRVEVLGSWLITQARTISWSAPLGTRKSDAFYVCNARSSIADKKSDGIKAVIGGMMVHMVFGTVFCWGNFHAYAPGHMRFWDGVYKPGVQSDTLQMI